MAYVIKFIGIISSILLSIGLCGACSIELSNEAPVSMFLEVYGGLIIIVVIGVFGLKVAHRPNYYFSLIYAIYHAIVNTFYITAHKANKHLTIVEQFREFFNEGLDVYDEYYYI